MGLFTNPLGHAGYPPRVAGTPETQPAAVQAATLAEAEAGVIDYKYISPATLSAASTADFASPPPIGSVAPDSGAFTTLTATTPVGVASGGTGAGTFTAHGVLLGEGTSAFHATTAGTAGQFFVSGGASADGSFQTATPQLIVTPVAGASQAMTSNHSYIANDSSLTTFTLPATAAVGDILQIVGSALNTGGWKVTYSTGQIIWGPAGSSTVTTGNAASDTAAAQVMTMSCVVANTTWVITNNSGTITLT